MLRIQTQAEEEAVIVPLDQPLAVGDRFASRYPAVTVHHQVIDLKPGKVRLQVLGLQPRGSKDLPDRKDGYRFWLDLDTVRPDPSPS